MNKTEEPQHKFWKSNTDSINKREGQKVTQG